MEDPPQKKQKLEDVDIFDNIGIENLAGIKCYSAINDLLPEDTGTVSLVVRAGFFCEETKDAGIAHVLEHVLVRGAVEATGSSLGELMFSHELHETAHGHTIFSFKVHGATEFSEAIKLLNMIAKQKVVMKDEHVKLEKKIVEVEYLTRLEGITVIAGDSFRAQLFQTSDLETCLNNLENIKSADLTNFYHTWYIPSHMAFIATGNFNTKKLLIEESSCSVETPAMDCIPGAIPEAVTAPSWTFELISLNDSNNENALVFKIQTPSILLQDVVLRILVCATARRLSPSGGFAYTICKGADVFIVFKHPNVHIIVYEFFRLKEYGLTTSEFERQINVIKREMRREARLFCLDEQHQMNVLQKKLRNNFLYGVQVTNLNSDLSELLAASDSLQDLSREFLGLLKIEQARLYVNESNSNSAGSLLEKVKNQAMYQWEDETEIINFNDNWRCEDSVASSTTDYKELGMREFKLINGMRILLCKSDIPPFECRMKGFAYGGLSEQDEQDYISSYCGLRIVRELPSFPLNIKLCGSVDVKIQLNVDDYSRSFEMVSDVSELEVILQYVYLLFYKKPRPDKEPLLQMYLDSAFDKWKEEKKTMQTVYELATGSSFIHKLPNNSQFGGADYRTATTFVSSCFSQPSEFTIVLVGDFDIDETGKLVMKYMGSIPSVFHTKFPTDRNGITSVPINFPREVLMHDVYADQIFKDVYICVPLKMDKEKQEEDICYIELLKDIVIQKLFRVLRQEMGEVYSIEGTIYFDGKTHYSAGSEEAILIVTFSYAAGDMDWELVKKALKSIEELQCALSKEDIACLSSFSAGPSKVWSKAILDEAIDSYQSYRYTGDLEKTMMARAEFLKNIPIEDVDFWKQVFNRIMPDKCSERSVSVVFHDKGKKSQDILVGESLEENNSEEDDTTGDDDSEEDDTTGDGDSEDDDTSNDEELSFVNMGLTAVPPEVCESNKIKELNLSENSIVELPVTISACSSLEALILSGNKIKDWPGDALKSLPTLYTLYLNSNPLNKIPLNGFEAVSRLRILNLNDCVSSLLGNPSFASLKHLEELYLSGVEMQEVPSDIVMLRRLGILDLSRNSLHSIPQGFQNLTRLDWLDLSDNSIVTLPPELGLLERNLTILELEGNPLRSISKTILDQGTEAVLKHLKDRIQDGR